MYQLRECNFVYCVSWIYYPHLNVVKHYLSFNLSPSHHHVMLICFSSLIFSSGVTWEARCNKVWVLRECGLKMSQSSNWQTAPINMTYYISSSCWWNADWQWILHSQSSMIFPLWLMMSKICRGHLLDSIPQLVFSA